MESSRRRTDPSVAELLYSDGCDFDFFQAVRLLLRLFPERQGVGETARPKDEAVRFRAHLSTAFPPSAVHQIADTQPEAPPEMITTFFGLVGAQGVLPLYYTEQVIARAYQKDTATAAFFDLFHHRLVSFLYRAWEKHHFPIRYEREAAGSLPAVGFTNYLFDLIGMGTQGLRGLLGIPDEVLLLYAGLLAQQPHSAAALRGMLHDYFGIPVEIEQFQGTWFSLEDDRRSYLYPEEDRNRLSYGAVAGDSIWNPQARFRIRLGPLDWTHFAAFLPGGGALSELSELVSHFAGPCIGFDIQLTLLASEVPPCLATDEAARAPLLGLSSWLDRLGFEHDAGDVILEGEREAA